MLEHLDLNFKLSKKQYQERLPILQRRLHQLQQACWNQQLASVLVFEGWDAAGKLSTIRKLTEWLEPRGFDMHATVAARSTELQMPWLWRFWIKVPDYGHMAIFERSWYRRVLIERVEELVPPEEWQRAYEEITSFERSLADDRYEVVKFFLHIDRAEQRRRLNRLQKDKRNAWRIEPTHLERHEKYSDYLAAAEEMLERTEAEWAPWTIVEATDKRWSRVKIFESLIARLETGLAKRGLEVPAAIEPVDPGHETLEVLDP